MITVLAIVLGLVLIAALTFAIVRMVRPGASAKVATFDAQFHARPPIGSPAQVWLDRGARAVQGMRNRVAETPGFFSVLTEADAVVEQLRADATKVTALNSSMADAEPDRLRDRRDDLAAQAAETANTDLAQAHKLTDERLTDLNARIAERDDLLARMQAAVVGLERSRDEVTQLLVAGSTTPDAGDEPLTALGDRVRALSAGYAELGMVAGPIPFDDRHDREIAPARPADQRRGVDGGQGNP
jgi:hypothetical protein